MNWAESREWGSTDWLKHWVAACDKDLTRKEPTKFGSETEARTGRFDFTSPWVDCVSAARAGMPPPDEVWSVADDMRKQGADWSLTQIRDILFRKANELLEIEKEHPTRNTGDWLVEIAVAIKHSLPTTTSWRDVDKFVRHMRDQHGLEVPGEVYTVVRGLIDRHKGVDAVTAPQAAQVLFIHGMMCGATMKNVSRKDADGMSGWR